MKYVILKKIDNVWYATRNRYTKNEVSKIADKLFDEVIDFEAVDDGGYYGIADGIIVVADDGRKLDPDKTYLTDNLKRETDVETGLCYLSAAVLCPIWLMTSMTYDSMIIIMALWVLIVKFAIMPLVKKGKNKNENKTMRKDDGLPDDHQTTGMMKGARL